ncbi:MAG: hypothetical protein HFJ48_00840 [Clostridia bacterium]|nr:hypothetical protein [Clostridia bacterium]
MDKQVIVEFTKNEEGVSVKVNNTETINVLIGIAETIQLISEETKKDKKSIISDINKILDILEKEEEN